MPQDPTKPLSIFTGQRSAVRLITRSHGLVRPNMVDTFEFTPKLSTKRVDEFDNLISALVYTTFDGGSGKIGYTDSNQNQISAVLMDLDPSVTTQMVNPANMAPFDGFINDMGLDGVIKAARLIYGCAPPMGNPNSKSLKDPAKRSIDFECLNGVDFYGTALLYTRARGTTVQIAPPSVNSLATATTGGALAGLDTIYVKTTAVTAAGETTVSQESSIFIPTGTSTNTVTVTVPAAAGAITGYNVYASNVSNGERFVAYTTSTTQVITALPSSTSVVPPFLNTSGSFVAPGDKIFTTSGSQWAITLAKTAFTHPQNGLCYALIKRDGVTIATIDNAASIDTCLFSSDGTTFKVNEDPAAHVWEILTHYQP